jgi:hypothetical protein
VQVSQRKPIENVFYERTAAANLESFAIFFQFGVFYAWGQLMDQQVQTVQ